MRRCNRCSVGGLEFEDNGDDESEDLVEILALGSDRSSDSSSVWNFCLVDTVWLR